MKGSTGSRDPTTNQRVTIFPVECNYVIPAIEGAEKRNLKRGSAWVAGEIGFPFRFLPHLPVRVIALVNNVDAAVVAQAVCCGHFIQSALETMVEARNFIPVPR